jgi:hypothetical protein
MYCCALQTPGADQERLSKLLALWESKRQLSDETIRLLRNPEAAWAEYEASVINRNAAVIAQITNSIQETLSGYTGQHMAFVAHAEAQLQRLNDVERQWEEYEKSLPPPDIFSRPPPVLVPPTVPPPGPPPQISVHVNRSIAYFDLPAALMCPLIELEDEKLRAIDPKVGP